MSSNLEYLDLILIVVIAGFIILRLRNILGRKTGYQGKPFNKFKNQILDEKEKNKSPYFVQTRGFDENQKKHFLNGAKIAYETILTSFAEGDKGSLKPLLSEKIFKEFSTAIDQRNQKKIKSDMTFIGIKSAKINNFIKKDNIYNVSVSFVSEIISCLKDKNDKIIEGNPNIIKIVKDNWKFSRNMWSENPTWYLAETLS